MEDDAGIARFIHRGLEANGYSVEWQTLGRHARQRLASGVFEAAILDLGLPDADGRDLCREARAQGIDLPICMLTARAALEDKLEGFRCGADDYLAKPFELDELLARIRALIRRGHQKKDPILRIHDLTIDTAARNVVRAGKKINLTPREYALLEFLCFHAGSVVTRTMIWEHLYDEYDENTSNVVDVYIRYLRNKIDKGFDAPLILTKWGEGYMVRGANDHEVDQDADTAEVPALKPKKRG